MGDKDKDVSKRMLPCHWNDGTGLVLPRDTCSDD